MNTPKPDLQFPPVLAKVNAMHYEALEGEGIDFEPLPAFLDPDLTTSWLRAWTGNPEASGDRLKVFGLDGTGGYSAFWCVEPQSDILQCPVVFLGSEGESSVVACNFSDYLCLLAHNHGACEACLFACNDVGINTEFEAFARKHATTPERLPEQIIGAARAAHPGFETWIQGLLRPLE